MTEVVTTSQKPNAPACERNQQVILAELNKQLRKSDSHVFEIGSGTGQHAVYFAQHLPEVTWQTSDVKANHVGIQLWLDEAQLVNVKAPIEFQIGQSAWPGIKIDVVFCANVLHIISFDLVQVLLKQLGENLQPKTRVLFYGPFKYQGEYTSDSNAEFDLWLKDIDPLRGIRDFEAVESMLRAGGITLVEDVPMPANNQLLVFEKQ